MPLVRYLPESLESITSRGSQAGKAGSLGGLAEKRRETLSQYFTPDWVVRFLWSIVAPAFDQDGKRYSLLDNSIGSGNMFRYANPDRFYLSGLDADPDLVESVCSILDLDERYHFDIVNAGIEQVELAGFSCALINPPFSIPLASPFLKPVPGVTHFGPHGPDTSANSHEYALAQALSHCDIVAAVVPNPTKQIIGAIPEFSQRLRAVFELPKDTFKDENVRSVNTDLLIFDRSQRSTGQSVITGKIDSNSIAPVIKLSCRSNEEISRSHHPIQIVGIEQSKPVITTPLTGDKTVVLKRAKRWIKLEFKDGATEGRVKNALYKERLFSTTDHKYPRHTRYSGQFKLNLDVLSMQSDPFMALNQVCDLIRSAGGEPVITTQLVTGLKNLIEENRRKSTPFGRYAYRKGTPAFSATAKKMALINPRQPRSAVRAGETVSVRRGESGFLVTTKNGEFSCHHDQFFTLFTTSNDVCEAGYWEAIYPPISLNFPKEIERLQQKAVDLDLDRLLTWDFQLEDTLELAFKEGGICGWHMGLGKSRLAISLAMLLKGKSLLVLKSRLVSEMVNELTELGITDYQVIRKKADIGSLKKINIISYETLKRSIHPKCPKLILAKFLRKKIDNILCDEGGLLAIHHSQQSQAVWAVGAKRKYILDGTPSPNYPREMQNLAAFVFGQERAYQPFSMKGGFIEARLFNSAQFQPTGRDEFCRRYVTLEWATNEFREDHERGAKREVAKINPAYLDDYRRWIAPMIKRRVQQEPAVKKHVDFPVPNLCEPVTVDWDFGHLALYVRTAEEFARWFRQYTQEQKENSKALNLAIILARLDARFKAANVPSKVEGYAKSYVDLTSKERVCLDMIKDEVRQGRRPIVFARNPVVLKRLSLELDKLDITNLVFTGEDTIEKRTEKLNARIRQGDDQVMLASLGVTQDGLNLPMLNSVIFYNRSWKSREEYQAIYRLIRPQQKSQVNCHFLHLSGSIDEYMAQVIKWKTLANEAGLDFGEQAEEEFVHFDAFIYRFLNSIPELKAQLEGIKRKAA